MYIYIYEQFSLFDNTNVSHWFHDFLKKHFFIQKSSFLINNLFGNVFQTLSVTGLITLTEVDLGCGNCFEELQTELFEVELIENNAQLTYVCPNTIETCLTPNHLLVDRQLLYFSSTTSITL